MNEAESKEAEPQYHPAVKKVLETTGPNIGRLIDKDLAYDLAQEQDQREDYEEIADYEEAGLVDPIKKEIAREAVAGSFAAGVIAEKAVYKPQKEDTLTNDSKVWLLNSVREEAAAAVKSADALLKVSKPLNDAQELKRAKEQLAAARNKINELETGKQ